MATEKSPLRRAIALSHATSLVIGTIIGASIFVQPSEITIRMNSLGGAMAAWAAAGALTLLGVLVVAELAFIFPKSGGVYVFLRETFSPLVGFLWGWAMFWIMHTGILAAIAVVFARYLGSFLPLGDLGTKSAAAAAILGLSAINILGVKPSTRLQTALTAIKVGAIVLLVVAGVVLGRPVAESAPAGVSGGASWRDFLLAVGAGLFAFGGWHMVTYSAGETRDPKRTLPRALIIGTVAVTICYMALNAIYFRVLPVSTVMSSQRVAADAADAIFGSGGGLVLSLLVVVSTLGALTGIVLAGPRVYLVMARDGLAPRRFAAIHPRFRTPYVAIALQGVWAAVLAVTGGYRQLFTRVIYTEWIFFGLLAIGLVLWRRRQADQRRRRFETPSAVALVFALASFAVVVNQISSEPAESLGGLLFVALGIPVYWFLERNNKRKRALP